MPFFSFLPDEVTLDISKAPNTFVVDINLLPTVDLAVWVGRCVNDDLLNELMQDAMGSVQGYRYTGDHGQEPVHIGTFTFVLPRFHHEEQSLPVPAS